MDLQHVQLSKVFFVYVDALCPIQQFLVMLGHSISMFLMLSVTSESLCTA